MERRVVAILVADVVGYSRLMGVDEEAKLSPPPICWQVVESPE